jgi:hypothetical protein
MKKIILITSALLALISCRQKPTQSGPEAVLARMRADTAWIHQLDSMAQIAIGPGAKCLDPVSHSFSYEGRTWLFNQDWGGVLEIPSDYLIEDDLWQAEFSFHGTRAWSSDSLIIVSFYAGFQALEYKEYLESLEDGLIEEGFSIISNNGGTILARNEEGINYYGRHLYANKDGIEYSVSVQWPDEKSEEAKEIIMMADRYPAGPNGNVFIGEAIR